MRAKVALFELPTLLGIPQYVEYEPPPRGWCTSEGCPHEGVAVAEGCGRGICVRYRAWVFSWDGRRWAARGRWRRRRVEESGGCLRQQVADALWGVAERGFVVEVSGDCGVSVDGVYIGRIWCRTADKCVEEILRAHERAKTASPKPRLSPEEEEYDELLRRHPSLRFWNKQRVIDIIRRGGADKWALQSLLSRLNNVDEFVWAFLARFELDLRCTVEVYVGGEELCVRFHVGFCEPRLYCYAPGHGWRPAGEMPKFLRLKPLEDGLVEVYTIENREYVRVV